MTRLSNRHHSWVQPTAFFSSVKNRLRGSTLSAFDHRPDDVEAVDGEDSRLKNALRRSRRARKPVLSRLRLRLEQKQAKRRLWQRYTAAVLLGLGLSGGVAANLFVQEKITLGGVPYRVISKFWKDPLARDAYFAADGDALHDRLRSLGVEEDIKDYYRDRFDTEYELDHHIHQIMYDRTGYVGEAYEVNKYGRLVSVKYKS